jgi:hypothetical protein
VGLIDEINRGSKILCNVPFKKSKYLFISLPKITFKLQTQFPGYIHLRIHYAYAVCRVISVRLCKLSGVNCLFFSLFYLPSPSILMTLHPFDTQPLTYSILRFWFVIDNVFLNSACPKLLLETFLPVI